MRQYEETRRIARVKGTHGYMPVSLRTQISPTLRYHHKSRAGGLPGLMKIRKVVYVRQ